MSNNVVFNEAEQVQLQQLTSAVNQFETLRQLILRSKFEGQDAALVVQAVSFFEGLMKQTNQQLDALRTEAAQRALKPKVAEIKEAKKKGKQ